MRWPRKNDAASVEARRAAMGVTEGLVTSIDLALSVIILFVLLGLIVRSALHFHKQSELPPVTWRRR